ncbi:probable ubiquitin-like-specific protease 2B isoform X2 [Andrographis paniculata]|uniref:probable ubiquitin-like-specific protease 2B isoform X2 n=1 Tax=Andrographis paniculata TaxID=175694 RepID=UPI0021E7022A|nr:probable ubiquitin-like-specific protease 2B isoform X2 [Andrographis paniculata]
MTETKTMENPNNSIDVEFKEEELTELPVKETSPKFGFAYAPDVSGTEMEYQENETGVCRSDPADTGYNHDSASSFSLINNNDFADMPDLSHVLHNGFKNHGQAVDTKFDVIQSGSGFGIAELKSSLDHTVRLEDRLNHAILEAPCNEMSVRAASDAEESMGKESPSGATTSFDGPTSRNYFSGMDMEGESAGVVLSTDYLEYCDARLLDCVVSFSISSVEVRGKTAYREEGTFHIDIDDIVKIESEWSARCETGTINIHFILKYEAEDNVAFDATGLQKLKFLISDCDWCKKQEAIESLNVRYRALWNVLLELEDCLPPSEGDTAVPAGSYFPKFDTHFEDVIYPKGDPDAVSISKRDVDLLLPDTFVNDTIIDFYIKHLKTRQNEEERTKYHFFNSFFFRKLADMDKDPCSAFDGKAAFQRVRKWTRKVNLLEKDFIFIPVNYNYHWSLIVICYFGEIANYEDVEGRKSARVPCILHMDSFRGSHIGLKDLMQSYLWEEWKERQKGSSDDLYSKFRNLKFVPLEIPQQPNLFDCGLFLLHYVERFLEEVPANFSIYKVTSSSSFLQENWFPPGDASLKRTQIEKLISDLLDPHSENCTPSGGSSLHSVSECPNITDNYENGGGFSMNIAPLSDCHKNSLHPIGQGIEMTLLPSSSARNNLCTTTSGLVLKDLFAQTSASESLSNAHWESLETKPSSLFDFKGHSLPLEAKVEANECFIQTELPEPVFQHLDSIAPEEHAFAYTCGDFETEPIHEPTQENIDTSVTSGELLNSVETNDCVGMSILLGSDPTITFSPNNSPEPRQEANHLPMPAFTSDIDVPDNSQSKTPTHTVSLKHPRSPSPFGNNGLDHELAAKKMRLTPLDDQCGEVTTSSSKDLTL